MFPSAAVQKKYPRSCLLIGHINPTDIVARVKPRLVDLSSKDARLSLLDDLQQIAILGETFTEQRPRGKVSGDTADTLDREGRRARGF